MWPGEVPQFPAMVNPYANRVGSFVAVDRLVLICSVNMTEHEC